MAKSGSRRRLGGSAGPFSETLIAEFNKGDVWIQGAFSLSKGFCLRRCCLRRQPWG